jgi:hypothetical protein
LTQKLFAVCVVAGLILSLAGATLAHDEKAEGQPGEKIERSLTVHPEAIVTLCVASGTLKVRGWEKSEIRVRSIDAVQIDFRRIGRAKDTSQPATRVDVMVTKKVLLGIQDAIARLWRTSRWKCRQERRFRCKRVMVTS